MELSILNEWIQLKRTITFFKKSNSWPWWWSVSPFSHQQNDRVRLLVFQADPIRPPIVYGATNVSRTPQRHRILSAKNRRMRICSPSVRQTRSEDNQKETDMQSIFIQLPHREEWAGSMSALQSRENLSSACSAERDPLLSMQICLDGSTQGMTKVPALVLMMSEDLQGKTVCRDQSSRTEKLAKAQTTLPGPPRHS